MAKKKASRVSKGKSIRCSKGYKFKSLGRNKVVLMRNNNHGATFTCECSTTGGCKVTIDPQDPQSISCLESGCRGGCGWVINLPGIVGLRFALLSR